MWPDDNGRSPVRVKCPHRGQKSSHPPSRMDDKSPRMVGQTALISKRDNARSMSARRNSTTLRAGFRNGTIRRFCQSEIVLGLTRAYLAASSQENTDVLHTVRASADATFDFYLPRGKKTVELQGIEGEPVILFQTDREEKPGSYTVRRNGVLVVRR